MGVISETVEKLRSPDQGGKERRSRLARYGNIYSLCRRWVVSPRGALCVAGLLIISGLVAGYGATLLGNYFRHTNRAPVSPKAEAGLLAGIDASSQKSASRRNGAARHAPGTGREKRSDAYRKSIGNTDTGRARYLPPTSETVPEEPSRELQPREQASTDHESGDRPVDLSMRKLSGEQPGPSTEVLFARGAPWAGEVTPSSMPSSEEQVMNQAGGEGGTKRTETGKPLPVAPGFVSPKNSVHPRGDSEETVPAMANSRSVDLGGSPDRLEGTSHAREGRASRAERIHLANVEKARKIQRLVWKIEKSIAEDNMDGAQTFIDQLAALKGEQNRYVLKLKAFWNMRQGDIEACASVLNAVLDEDPDDLEAGVNMAIIEIKTRRLDEARKRLGRLRDIYPGSTVLEELIEKIGR